MKYVSLNRYIKEILIKAEYRKDNEIHCVVGIASILPGCMTQGDSYEETRENLIDAIELWITIALREGEELPVVNDCVLASSIDKLESDEAKKESIYV
jgi:predicted RNase H-like HicB family nuclease